MSPTHSTDGIDFAYLDEGSGPAFVFQHGLGGDSSQPRELWDGTGRLVCLECRGHGRTTPLGAPEELGFATFARDLASLLDALDLDEVVLGGVSMGAGVALRLAYEQPERIRALVLVRPAWFTAASPANLNAFPVIAELLRTEGRERGRGSFQTSEVYRRIREQSRVGADSLLAQFERPQAVERAALLERLPADRPLPDAGPWPRLAMPSLVIGTEQDPVHPFACAEAWAEALPAGTLRKVTPKTVDDARYAEDVTATIAVFLSSTHATRPLTAGDRAYMERVMLWAGFPPDREPPAGWREMPHVRRFLDGWGRSGDVGVVAVDARERPLGAAWARALDEPALRDEAGAAVPELAIAVEPHARGNGVGGALLDALAEAARHAGHRELSLTVSPRNPAARLYARRGFEPLRADALGLVMRRRLE